MAVKLRLTRIGRRNAPYFRIVAADSRRARNGKFIEIVGKYHPLPETEQIEVNEARVLYWLSQGAIPTETVRSILSKVGVLRKFDEMKKAHSTRAKAEPAPTE